MQRTQITVLTISRSNLLLLLLLELLHISQRSWSFTGVWVTASLLKSPGLFSVFYLLNNVVVWMVSTRPPTSKSSSPFSYCTKSTNYNWYNCHLHVPYFFQFPSKVEVFILLFTFFQFILWSAGTAKSTILQVLFFCWLLLGLVFWPRLGDPSVRQSPIGLYVRYFLGQVLGCVYTICLYGQI